MTPELARLLWHRIEAVNAVTYFSPECRERPADLGLKGFWMGYFGCRAAPMGAVTAGVVEATFYNFHPERVRRAIPDAWAIASPQELVVARADAAAAALRRLLGADGASELAAKATPVLGRVIERSDPAGRPLFAANREVRLADDPVAALWQSATTIREHRGDSHIAALVGAGLDGCEAHVLFASAESVDPQLYQRSRGWSADDWSGATERLAKRGLLTSDGVISSSGRSLRESIERRTDELAAVPFGDAGDEIDSLLPALGAAASTIARSGDLVFPNPMGLPPS